jgi:hypothetical protein
MVIHELEHDQKGAGKWDLGTTRYIPMQGGSRSRLPVRDDPDYRRYPGFVGEDERMTESVYTIAALYTYLGGAPIVPRGQEGGFTSLILDQTVAKLQAEKEEAEEKAKRGERPGAEQGE